MTAVIATMPPEVINAIVALLAALVGWLGHAKLNQNGK